VLAVNRLAGKKVKTVCALLRLTVPATDTPPAVTVTTLLLTVAGSRGVLITTSIRALTGTFVVPAAGLITCTVGDDASVALPVVK